MLLNTLVIDRSKWLTPETSLEASCLLNPKDGKMCCLGQYGLQSGMSKNMLCEQTTPYDYVDDYTGASPRTRIKAETVFKYLLDAGYNNFICKTLMSINDTPIGDYYTRCYKNEKEMKSKLKSQKHKEQLITKEFAKIGVKVTFIGELDLL